MTVDTESFSIQQLHRDIYPPPPTLQRCLARLVATQIELPNELFSYVMIVSRWLLWTYCLAMESFLGIITFESVLLTRFNLRLVRSMHYCFWDLFACSLTKCVEVRLFDNENKGNNFFNMPLKTITTFESSLRRRNLFLHGILQIMAIFNFANALVWPLSLTWNVTIRNGFWIHSWELSIRPYLPSKAREEPGKSSPVSVDHRSKIDLKWCLARTFSQGVTKTQTPLCYLIFVISLFNFDPENAP